MKRIVLPLMAAILVLAACGESGESGPSERATSVTAAKASSRTVARTELSIGRLRANTSPSVSAETSGRIRVIHADVGDRVEAGDLLAEIDSEVQQIAVSLARASVVQLQAQLENQKRRVQRLTRLAEQQSIAEDQLDDATTSIKTMEAQLDAAQAQLSDAEYHLEQAEIYSPVSGDIKKRLISTGDYVSDGQPVYELVSSHTLQAFLPLPEHVQEALEVGQTVYLSVPARPDEEIEAKISEIDPTVGDGSRAIEIIVDLDNPGRWRSGGSVTGKVVLDEHQGLVVNPGSVVRRPSGTVVYEVDGQRAAERKVEVGLRGDGWIEIVDGLDDGALVVVDGAGFLSDDALIDVKENGEDA